MSKKYQLATIAEIINDAKQGKMFIIIDDENRENEGDLVIPAEFADSKAINFMARYGRGLICLTLSEERVKTLKLPLMSPFNNSRHNTAFTVSIEAREGVTTGISAQDRATTIKTAIDPKSTASDLCSPGHIFPLIARNGGVLTRAGHTESSVDISRMAGLDPSSVICEIMNEDGTMARLPDLIEFAKKYSLKIASIADLISYRCKYEDLIEKKTSSKINTKYGDFEISIYSSKVEYAEHIVLKKGNIDLSKAVLVRMHAQNVLSDILRDMAEGRDDLLDKSLKLIAKEGGILVLLRSPQKNCVSKQLQDRDNPITKKTDEKHIRDYGIGAQILKNIGVKKMKLISKTKKSVIGLESYDLEITDYICL